MAGKTATHEASVLNLLRSVTFTGLAAYVALYTVTPSDTAAGTEVTGNAYARQLCGFGAPTGNSPSSMANAADILFPVQTPAGYGAVVAVGLLTAVTAGTLLVWVGITTITFAAQSQAKFAAGALVYTED